MLLRLYIKSLFKYYRVLIKLYAEIHWCAQSTCCCRRAVLLRIKLFSFQLSLLKPSVCARMPVLFLAQTAELGSRRTHSQQVKREDSVCVCVTRSTLQQSTCATRVNGEIHSPPEQRHEDQVSRSELETALKEASEVSTAVKNPVISKKCDWAEAGVEGRGGRAATICTVRFRCGVCYFAVEQLFSFVLILVNCRSCLFWMETSRLPWRVPAKTLKRYSPKVR